MKKSIVLFGTGLEAEKFYCNYRNQYEIEFAIDNYRNSKKYHELDVYTLDEIKECLSRKYIVVAAVESRYKEIRQLLKQHGLVEFKNFIFVKWFNRKIVLLYGNCHIGAIEKMLNNNQEFVRTYTTRFFCLNEGLKNQFYPEIEDIQNADIIICHDIQKENKLHAPDVEWIKEQAKEDCKVIVVPNIWGINFIWPQVKIDRKKFEDKSRKKHINIKSINEIESRSNEEKQRIWRVTGGLIGHHDSFIEQNISLDVNEIVLKIRNECIWNEDEIKELFNRGILKLRDREEKCDVKISEYIKSNIGKMQLFYDEGHPHENLLREKTRQILKILKITPNRASLNVIANLDSEELFVYGCVKKALNMNWKQDYIRMNNAIYTLEGHAMSLPDFVYAYKAWMYIE